MRRYGWTKLATRHPRTERIIFFCFKNWMACVDMVSQQFFLSLKLAISYFESDFSILPQQKYYILNKKFDFCQYIVVFIIYQLRISDDPQLWLQVYSKKGLSIRIC
jgi:hypothetical protein